MSSLPVPQADSSSLPLDQRGLGRLVSWLRGLPLRAAIGSPTAVLLGAGLLLPNLLSIATLGNFIDVGLPPRTGCILLYAALAMSVRVIPFYLTAVLYLAILAFDVVWTLSVSFGLRPHDLVAAVDQARRLHLLASPLYAGLIAVMTATALSTLYLLSRRTLVARGNLVVLFVAALALAAADFISNSDEHYQFGAMFGQGVPNVSAASASGFNKVAGVNGRNVVLVIVESLGNFIDADARNRIVAPIYDKRITDQYSVSYGTIPYYGSTTSGEMRELCDTRAPFAEFVKSSGYSCLPERLYMRGYRTTAVHAFYSGMFERNKWYPMVGIHNMDFAEKLMPQMKRRCGAAFRGVCDADLPPVIERLAAESTQPNFIYWLTLNTHIPVAPGEALTNFHCARADNGFGLQRVCAMAELWHDVFRAVADLALNPAVGPAEILVVGDHAPPLWSKKGRAEFEAGKVAWYRLTPRSGVVAITADNETRGAALH